MLVKMELTAASLLKLMRTENPALKAIDGIVFDGKKLKVYCETDVAQSSLEKTIAVLQCKNGARAFGESDLRSFSKAYPAVEVSTELVKIEGWMNDNPNKRPTLRGCNAFLHKWMKNARPERRGRAQGDIYDD